MYPKPLPWSGLATAAPSTGRGKDLMSMSARSQSAPKKIKEEEQAGEPTMSNERGGGKGHKPYDMSSFWCSFAAYHHFSQNVVISVALSRRGAPMARKSHRLFQRISYIPMTGRITHPMFQCHQKFERQFPTSLLPKYQHQ